MSVVKKCFKLLKLRQHFEWIPEREVVAYLRNWNLKLKSDEYWNLYLINPGTPLICAHMDTVQREDSVDRLWTLRLKDWIIKADDAIIWWDDKCWIAIAMELYEKLWNKISLLFTRQEETWCNWAREFCNKHWDLVQQCKYCLVLDRRWAWDIIWYNNSYCSKEFEDELARLTKEFWYKPTTGLCSDMNHIAKLINWVNLSVGYYNPHTKQEYIKCDELVNAYETARYIIKYMDWDFPIYKYKPTYNNYSYGYNYNYDYDRYAVADKHAMWLFWYDYDDEDLEESWKKYWWWKDAVTKKDKKTKKEKKNNNKWNPLLKYTGVTKDWDLVVNEEVFLVNTRDDSDWIVIPEWIYQVLEWYDEQ